LLLRVDNAATACYALNVADNAFFAKAKSLDIGQAVWL